MQIDINVKTYSTKQRILAFFMAFMIFTMTCPELFEGWGIGLIVHAAYDSHIQTGDTTACMANGTSSAEDKFTYAGKMKTGDVTVFDYLTDREIEGASINLGPWGSGGYLDPYFYFNEAISEGNVTSDNNENITVLLENAGTGDKWIYLWDSSGDHGYSWPGQKMTYLGDNKYIFTFSPTTMGFTPSHVKFAKSNGSGGYTETVARTNCSQYSSGDGYTYAYAAGNKYYFWANNSSAGISPVANAADYTYSGTCLYNNPLYLGMFYISNNASSYTPAAISSTYTIQNYNNFHWLTNMGLKNIDDSSDNPDATNTNGYKYRGSAAVQGLVKDILTEDGALNTETPKGKLRQPDNTELPYFSTYWADNHSALMKYYNHDGGNNIAFPFYEVTTPIYGSGANSNVQVKGTTQSGDYAKYYQFSSKDSNLVFTKGSGSNEGYFKESGNQVWSSAPTSTVGFFPFDTDNHNDDHTKNNLGFGMKWEMLFTLQPDGCVGVVDSIGDDRDSNDYPERVHTTFEFKGDDDLWVFIDGKLILDMGGDHYGAYGKIDFATGIASVDKAVQYTVADQNNLALSLTAGINVPTSSGNFKTQIAGYDIDHDTYDSRPHVITIFYMERGMGDSNLLIRYNYSTLNNFSKMKVQEITNFDNVNKGLLNATMKAAENDVFKYTVSNTGTVSSDVKTQSKVYPENADRTRTNQGINTVLTTAGTGDPTNSPYNYRPPGDSSTEGFVADTSYIWVDDFAGMNHSTQGTGKTTAASEDSDDGGGSFFLMYGTKASTSVDTTDMESSAEFGKQFSRYSLMRVRQIGDDGDVTTSDDELYLYKPVRDEDNDEDNDVPFVTTKVTSAPRLISDYYTQANPYIFSNIDTTDTTNVLVNKNAQFAFRNDIDKTNYMNTSTHDSNEVVAVQMTEVFENTVRTGTLNITKNVTGPSENTNYTFELTLTKVFGGSEAVSDYTVIKALKGVMSEGVISGTPAAGLIQGTSKGTFTLQTGQTLSIAGIPYGTQYTINENTSGLSQQPQTIDGTVTSPTEFKTESLTITVTNTYPTETSVTVTKTGETGDQDLSGAEMELWYRESSPSTPTYSFSDPKIVPNEKNGVEVSKSANDIGVPGLQVNKTKITTYSKSDTYVNPAVPSSEDEDWILPRSDSDYIYFRDYNVGQYAGDRDKVSFTTNDNNVSAGKRSWRYTYFAQQHVAEVNNPYTHNQTQELGFNDNYWYAAEFYSTNKKTVKYAMWERFVDKFTYTPSGGDSTTTVDTVVWKIQPPDGYDQVRFILLDGDNWIRSTEKFTFNLGEIYHKTSWGGVYSNDNYYDVPVNRYTGKSDANLNRKLWAPAAGSVADNRNTAMDQPRKYEPTNQKVIFYCNSTEVWHNIHIQFFTEYTGSGDGPAGTITESNHKYTPVNDQAFPGYMMEPYAYAESNYRLMSGGKEQYLTYELTIPKGATHFRINNGISSGTYAYMTKITELANETNVKNGGNYWVLNATATSTESCLSGPVELTRNVSTIIGLSHEDTTKTYSESDITSDYDYIYFDAPLAGWDKVYAYFYGGGNLRDDNWQRACYSAWPGVAPVGTDYWSKDENNDSTANVHSNTYSIQTNGNTYNGKDTKIENDVTVSDKGTLSPEASFTLSDHIIYKFRIPKGDRKNYSNVVFNNGLDDFDGGSETGVIGYEAGYIYNKSGTPTKHYEKSYTYKYTGRTASAVINAGETNAETVTWTEYVYVKNTQNWDDLHITFYDNKGKQIYQKGCGYVMDYAGTLDETINAGTAQEITVSRKYYRMPIPADAATFSVNNGIGTTATPKCDITRLGSDAKSTATVSTDDKFVYELDNSKLTRLGVTVGDLVEHTTTTSESQTESTANYNPPGTNLGVRKTGSANDTLNIRDDSPWNVAVGGATVTFYNANGGIVGSGVMMKTNADNDGKIWYTKKIPTNAKSFSVSYVTGSPKTTKTTTTYPIYSSTADSNGNKTSTGDMFYKTVGTNQLSMLYAEPAVNKVDDENYVKRGDDLYLICDSSTAPTVTFYGGSKVIVSGITAKYINADESSKHWFKVSIPKGADNFSLGNSSKQYPIYELKTKYSPYQRDYTLGDMQYSVSGTTATPVYPVFKEDSEYTLTVGDTTISSRAGLIPVDESEVAAYANADAPTRADTTSANESPVLYETDSTNITYTWSEGTDDPNYNYVRFKNTLGWTGTITAKFKEGDSSDQTVSASSSTGSGVNEVFYFQIPSGNYKEVYFSNGSNRTVSIKLKGNSTVGYGHGYMYYPATITDNLNVSHSTDGSGNYYVQVADPTTANVTITVSSDVPTISDGKLLVSPKQSHQNAAQIIWYNWSDTGDDGTWDPLETSAWNNSTTKYSSPDSVNVFQFSIYPGANAAQIICTTDQSNGSQITSRRFRFSDIPADKPVVYIPNDSTPGSHWGQTEVYDIDFFMPSQGKTTAVNYNGDPVTNTGNSLNYTAAYQAEDRYGYISSVSGTDDSGQLNNFIYVTVPDSIDTPYIKFFDGSTYIGTVASPPSGVTSSSKGILLNGTDMKINNVSHNMLVSTGTGTKTYRVRLPKNAQSFKIFDGDNESDPAQSLYGSVTVRADNGQRPPNNYGGNTVVLTNFHHAGSTFTVTKSDTTITVSNTAVRANTPVQSEMDDPLNPKTDSDFVFLTVPSGWSAPYAYFYGNKDGEYDFTQYDSTNEVDVAVTWPGVRDSGSYTDSNNYTVYRFQIPKNGNGTYSYVMFNNGTYETGNITEAVQFTAGGNYTLTSTTKNYGKSVTAYALSTGTKAPDTATVDYSSGDYIYIINNGTQDLTGSTVENTRKLLDEMHVTFFSDANGGTVVGTGSLDAATNANAGYIPDKVGTTNESTGIWTALTTGTGNNNVYRIQVPSGAKYFQINNGVGKGSGSANYSLRKSEIKELTVNGLYKFVDTGTAKNDFMLSTDTAPIDVASRQDPHYLLELTNKLTEGDIDLPDNGVVDIHLATIVTGADGSQSYIKWLRPGADGTGVDTTYLNHTTDDIGPTADNGESNTGFKTVKVKKQGEYYWKEVVAPSGYSVNENTATFNTSNYSTPSIADTPNTKTGKLTLNKNLTSKKANNEVNDGEGVYFIFNITLIAPVGTDWNDADPTPQLSFKTKTGDNNAVAATPISDVKSSESLTRVIRAAVPATGLTDFIIENIPSGTAYYVTEEPVCSLTVDNREGNSALSATVTLTAPSGTDWADYKLTYSSGTPTESAPSNVLTITNISVAANGKLDIGGIPSNTSYEIKNASTNAVIKTGTLVSEYSSEPVAVSETMYRTVDNNTSQSPAAVDEIENTIPSYSNNDQNAVSYKVTNERIVGSLTLGNTDTGAMGPSPEANINPVNAADNTKIDYTPFKYVVYLKNDSIDLRDYIAHATLTNAGGYNATVRSINANMTTESSANTVTANAYYNTDPVHSIQYEVDLLANNGTKTLNNLPVGTAYTVWEIDADKKRNEAVCATNIEVPSSLSSSSEQTGSSTKPREDSITLADLHPTTVIHNDYRVPKGEVILTKTAKEKVGTTDIGDTLAGAKFLVKEASDDSLVGTFSENTLAGSKSYTFGSGTFNTDTNYLETGTDGKLHIKDLPYGDYYLEEQAAPNGYSHLDSNTGTNKKVYFSVGENREVKEISATDEMAPAYIKLFEHIDMKKNAWGNPTFVFKIKQTQHYELVTENNTTEWKLNGTDDPNGKEILVALTVDDNNNIKQVCKWFGADGTTPTLFGNDFDDPISTDYNSWFVEGTTDLNDYQGLFNIDSKGRIRVEPGKYEITRLPVSRYEFVTNGKTAAYNNDNEPPAWTEYKEVNNAKSEKLTIDDLPAGKTIDVHYYDKVGYYDKFSQVKEAVNQFYTLDANKANKTIKGIRVEDYKVDTVSTTDMDSVGGNGTLTTLSLQQSRRFKAYYIYADGTESQITNQAELAKFVISYEYDSTSGDNANFATDFFYDETNDQISVANYSTYKNGVYTLKATYDSKFSANFDIVFERS